jgi:hypothetical protein
MNQEIIPKPFLQRVLSRTVKISITKNLRNAVLYNCLNKSIIICVNENPTYTIAGAHTDIYIILRNYISMRNVRLHLYQNVRL